MPWSWRYEPDSTPSGGTSQEFPTQADAETWIGETWRDLLEGGVTAVHLLEDGRVVYGPMSLNAE